MKNYRTSIIAAVILVVCLAMWFVADSLHVEKKYNTNGEREKIVAINRNDLKSIEFENSDESFVLIRKDGKFTVDNRITETDENAAAQLLDNILEIDGRLIQKSCSDTGTYGLDTPAAKVTYTENNGKKTVLALGSLTPAKTEYYLLNGDGSLYSIYMGKGNRLSTKRWQLMNTAVFGMSYETLAGIRVEGQNSYTATKQSTGVWSVSSDSEGSFDAADEKVRAAVGLYIENMYAKRMYENNAEKRAEYGLDNPEGVVTLKSRDGSETRFTVRRNADKKEAAVIKNDGGEIYITIKSYFDMLDVTKEDLIQSQNERRQK